MNHIGTTSVNGLLHRTLWSMADAAMGSTGGFALPLLKYLPAFAAVFAVPVPAHAAGGIALPEPSSMLLLGLGVVGVAIGRKLSSRRSDD